MRTVSSRQALPLSRRLLASLCLLGALLVVMACSSAAALADFGASLDMSATNADGTPDVQAGSHPYELTTTIRYNLTERGNPEGGIPKDILVDVPPGLLANPLATPRCSMTDFAVGLVENSHCPADTQIGVIYLDLIGVSRADIPLAVYNLTPPAGKAVAFGLKVAAVNVAMTAALRTGGDYGATVSQLSIPEVLPLASLRFVIWGVPGEAGHDALRFDPDTTEFGATFASPVLPFLRLPTLCEDPGEGMVTRLRTDSWQNPGQYATASSVSHLNAPDNGVAQGMAGCGKLDFSPTISVQPAVAQAASPEQFNIDIHIPQSEVATGLTEADLRKAVVTLPAGVSISPSTADGLGACSTAQVGLGTGGEPACPDNSKIGDVEVRTPLLERALTGGVYIAQPYENPFGSLFALYVTMEEPQSGVLVKLAGRVTPDPVTGQLTVTFENNPPLPFSDFKMKMIGGARASLSSPPACGVFTTSAQLTPWSSPIPVDPSDSFTILSGANGGPCLDPLPFNPGFYAGTVNPQAGAFTPFTMRIARNDGDQTLAGKFQVQTPAGMLGMLSGVALCKEPAASQGSCGTESQIGHVTVGTGPGPQPFYVHGAIYLTESFKGAPFGLSIVVPAVAGPFNLGNVVVRAAINIDPADSHLYVTTEPIPTILEGIPIQVRSIQAVVDRERFIFNPSSCAPTSVRGVVASVEGVVAHVQSPFQVGYCALLPFKPSFKVTAGAHTSRRNGASLDAKLTFPAGTGANLAKVKVALPKQLPSRLTTLQKACSDAQFTANPDFCPAASRIGYARVSTPVLSDPLAGPVYFVSHGGAAFPDLVIVLQGDGVRVDVVGSTNISKTGITSTSFHAVQDVPIRSFELYLPQGPNSALAANGTLCGRKLKMPTAFIAQNGAQIHRQTQVAVSGCGKARGARNSSKASGAQSATGAALQKKHSRRKTTTSGNRRAGK